MQGSVTRANAERCALICYLSGCYDQTVNPACANELFRLTTHVFPKELHWLEQPDHVITTGPEREKFFALRLSFIRATMESSSVHQS